MEGDWGDLGDPGDLGDLGDRGRDRGDREGPQDAQGPQGLPGHPGLHGLPGPPVSLKTAVLHTPHKTQRRYSKQYLKEQAMITLQEMAVFNSYMVHKWLN